MIEVGTTEKWSTMTSPEKAGFVFQKKRDLLPRINSRSDATYAWLSLRRARFTGSALFRALYTLVFLFRIVGVRPVLSWASTAVYVREQCCLYVLGSEMRAS